MNVCQHNVTRPNPSYPVLRDTHSTQYIISTQLNVATQYNIVTIYNQTVLDTNIIADTIIPLTITTARRTRINVVNKHSGDKEHNIVTIYNSPTYTTKTPQGGFAAGR